MSLDQPRLVSKHHPTWLLGKTPAARQSELPDKGAGRNNNMAKTSSPSSLANCPPSNGQGSGEIPSAWSMAETFHKLVAHSKPMVPVCPAEAKLPNLQAHCPRLSCLPSQSITRRVFGTGVPCGSMWPAGKQISSQRDTVEKMQVTWIIPPPPGGGQHVHYTHGRPLVPDQVTQSIVELPAEGPKPQPVLHQSPGRGPQPGA